MAANSGKGKAKASYPELEGPFLNLSKSLTSAPSSYCKLPRFSRLSAPIAASLVGITDDPLAEEGEGFDRIVTINTKPELKITAHPPVQKNEGRGPSLQKVLSVTEKLRGRGIKLERAKVLIVNGIWNIKDAWIGKLGQETGQTPAEQSREETLAIDLIVVVIKTMASLEEFVWRTELPFTKALWTSMSATVTSISFNLFKSGMEERGRDDLFAAADLCHLREFKSLKRLSICGMLDSCQRQVWEAVWVLPSLKHLDLRMALGPEHRDPDDRTWPSIETGWQMKNFSDMEPNYWGRKGRGLLNIQWGYGEYLDVISIRKAWCRVHPKQECHPRMKLESLILGNFVVDARPFVDVLDESTLKRLQFVDTCLDAGFTLPPNMLIDLLIIVPDRHGNPASLQTARFHHAGSARLVDIPPRKKWAGSRSSSNKKPSGENKKPPKGSL